MSKFTHKIQKTEYMTVNFYHFRMMSDELSSWKVTLYTRFKQAQSALQRLLDERTQLQQYLTQTKRSVFLTLS